jgi:hypothetical protein
LKRRRARRRIGAGRSVSRTTRWAHLSDSVIDANIRDETARILKMLSPKQEKVIRLRFGIGCEREHTLGEIGGGAGAGDSVRKSSIRGDSGPSRGNEARHGFDRPAEKDYVLESGNRNRGRNSAHCETMKNSMVFDLAELDVRMLEEVCRVYEEQGYCVLSGLKERVTSRFYPLVREALGVNGPEWAEALDPRRPGRIFPPEIRRKLARVETPGTLAHDLLGALRPVLSGLIGPLVHVSSTSHAQFKGVPAAPVDHGGYESKLEYMEVHGAYWLHQDFTGASIPTSPSGLTLWIGLNECPDWTLRLYPGSHRLGLLCNRWLPGTLLRNKHPTHPSASVNSRDCRTGTPGRC